VKENLAASYKLLARRRDERWQYGVSTSAGRKGNQERKKEGEGNERQSDEEKA